MVKKEEEEKRNLKKKRKVYDKPGQPTRFNQELADYICHMVSTHPMGTKKLHRLYGKDGFPAPPSITEWRLKYESFSAQYARAKLAQADILAEDCLDIADDDSGDNLITENGKKVANVEFMSRSRLRIDTRKWLASKLIPKVYGDKIQLEQKSEENDALKEELLALRKKLDDDNKKDY
jgi:hypothetical protein